MRDINLESTIYPRFTSRAFATGIPTTLAGTPVLSVYEENNLTQITAGVSVSADYDSVAGFNQATIVATAANGYEAGKSYDLVITTGTVGGVSVVGEIVGSFTVEGTRAALVDDIWNEPIVGHISAGTTGLSEALGGAAIVDTTITGTPTTTVFAMTAGSATDDFYNDQVAYILSGTGIGQCRVVLDYDGATKTVTIDEPFIATPVATDRVVILIDHVHPITQIAHSVWDDDISAHTTANSAGKALQDIEDDTNELQTDDVPGLIAALNDISVADVLTTQMTEAYAADGTAPTLAQAIFLIQQSIGDFSISGTTLTAKKLDGSTTAATYTLDDATAPTSRTRAT